MQIEVLIIGRFNCFCNDGIGREERLKIVAQGIVLEARILLRLGMTGLRD